MAVVVSDATPLHYLILIGRDSVLEKLYQQVLVPPAVVQELRHPAAPSVPARFDNLDFGEQQALALAKEIHADFVLLDDRVARRFAENEALKVKGTLGIVADAAKAGLLNFRATVETLRRSTMHLDAKLAQRIIEEYEKGPGRRG